MVERNLEISETLRCLRVSYIGRGSNCLATLIVVLFVVVAGTSDAAASTERSMIKAAGKNNVKTLEKLYERIKGRSQETLLSRALVDAVRHDANEAVQFLLEHGADPNGYDVYWLPAKKVPLLLAAVDRSSIGVVGTLLKHGANTELGESAYELRDGTLRDSGGGSSMGWKLTANGMTALGKAVKEKRTDFVRLLLKHGADPDKPMVIQDLSVLCSGLLMRDQLGSRGTVRVPGSSCKLDGDSITLPLSVKDVNRIYLRTTPLAYALAHGSELMVSILRGSRKEEAAENDSETVRGYHLAAEQGNPRAQVILGFRYATGKGVPKNDAEAAKLYRLAADQGLAEAQLALGRAYKFGSGVRKNDTKARKLYRLAADQGLAVAQLHLAIIYDDGDGVRENKAKALKLYRLAADQGLVGAQLILGKKFSGVGDATANFEESAKWFRLAANQGDRDAQFYLGSIYFLGWGVPEDYVRGHAWISLAASQGHEQASIQKVEVASLMTLAQLADAQELAAELHEQIRTNEK